MIRYRILMIFLIVLVISSVAVGSVFSNSPDKATASGNIDSEVGQTFDDLDEDDDDGEVVTEQKRKYFANFDQCYRYATNYINSLDGYKTFAVGNMDLGYEWYTISEKITAKKVVDNVNKQYSNEFCMNSTGSIGKNGGILIASDENKSIVQLKQVSYDNYTNDFDFSESELQTMTFDEYIDAWGMKPQDLCLDFIKRNVNFSKKSLSSNNQGYTLRFQADSNIVFPPFWTFIKSMLNYYMVADTIVTVQNINVEMHVDKCGVLKDISASASVTICLDNLPFPYKILPDMSGTISYKETFKLTDEFNVEMK